MEPEIRQDLTDAHNRAWDRLGRPGTWLTAEERVYIASETRSARYCSACTERKNALSPETEVGPHSSESPLKSGWIETIHRITQMPIVSPSDGSIVSCQASSQ